MTTDIVMGQAFDLAVQDLERMIDRHFTSRRELIVSNDEGANWTAAIGDTVLYRSPDGAATLRFARTFCERTPGVTLVVADDDAVRIVDMVMGHSVRVPDNVVPLKAPA